MNVRRDNSRIRPSCGRMIAVCMAILVLGSAVSALAQKAEKNPRIEVPDDYFYFGYMPRDAIVAHTYWIKNSGEDTLQIIQVKPGCGCTTAPLKQDKIAPGDSTDLKITFNSKLMTGKVVKDVSIFSNDPGAEVTSIKFFAVVNQQYANASVDPATLRFAKFGSANDKLIKELKITNNSDDKMQVVLVEFPDKYFTIDKKSVELGSGKDAVFTLEQVKVPTDDDDILTSVTLEFRGSETERITVPIVSYFKRGE